MALDVASSLLMWDVECAMRVDRKKKKKNATSRICDKGRLETRLETLFSTLRNFVKKVRSFFFYSPSPKVIRISLSLEIDPRNIFSFQISLRIERLRDRFRFSKAFVDWTIGEIALLKRIYEKGRMIERNSILSQWKAALLLCSEAVKHGLVRGSWKRAETMIESWSVSFQWGTMCNWEGQGALL